MNYCKICLNLDTRPGSVFPEKNLCPACKYYIDNKETDYEARLEFLQKLIKKFPRYPRRRLIV